MKIFVASMMHETNTFTTGRTDYEHFSPVIGDEIYHASKWEESSAMGSIQTLKSEGVSIFPSLFGSALPSGLLKREAYLKMKERILNDLQKADELDGVCLALHGSMYAEGIDDVEGDLLEAIRQDIGKDIPIVVALDMHASMTERMVNSVNGIVAYRTAPHIDMKETGVRAANLLLTLIREKMQTTIEWIQIPLLLCGEQSETNVPPMAELIAYIKQMEKESDILSADYLLGFPWADSTHNGVSVVVVGRQANQSSLKETAKQLARKFWAQRHRFDFTTEAYPFDEAVTVAIQDERQPIVIADSGDNPTAGASEDVTYGLKKLIESQVERALYAVIFDEQAWNVCQQTQVGREVALSLGRLDFEKDIPYQVKGKILLLKEVDGVGCAVVQTSGVTFIITNRRTAVTDPAFLQQLGINPFAYKVIVIKSGYLFPKYQKLAARKILALTPGDTNVMLRELPYKKVSRPIYPFDMEMNWRP